MPKPGYTQLIVKTKVRSQLEDIARNHGYRSVNQLLEAWITGRVNPGVNPTLRNGVLQVFRKGLETSPVSRTEPVSLVRGVGFEPTNPYGTAASGLRL